MDGHERNGMMKKAIMMMMIGCIALGMIGCDHAAKNQPAKDMLRVMAFKLGADAEVTGTLNGKTYGLQIDRQNVPVYIAYYEPIDVQDVGKTYPAHYDSDSQEVVVQGTDKGTVRYHIISVAVLAGN